MWPLYLQVLMDEVGVASTSVSPREGGGRGLNDCRLYYIHHSSMMNVSDGDMSSVSVSPGECGGRRFWVCQYKRMKWAEPLNLTV